MSTLEYYRDIQGLPYIEPNRRGYLTVDILPVLIGEPWNALALAYVHSVKPSFIRVTTGEETTDSLVGRVTVIIDENGIIETIDQEVEVGLPDGVEHGADLRYQLESQ